MISHRNKQLIVSLFDSYLASVINLCHCGGMLVLIFFYWHRSLVITNCIQIIHRDIPCESEIVFFGSNFGELISLIKLYTELLFWLNFFFK